MSFLNSVLSSIGGDEKSTHTASVSPVSLANSRKRKARDDDTDSLPKLFKPAVITGLGPPLVATSKDAANDKSLHRNPGSESRTSVANETHMSRSKNGERKIPTTSKASVKQPKKGSFKEIMARTQRQSTQADSFVGTIRHRSQGKDGLNLSKGLRRPKLERGGGVSKSLLGNGKPESNDGSERRRAHDGVSRRDKNISHQDHLKERTQPVYKGTMHPTKQAKSSVSASHSRPRTGERMVSDEEHDLEQDPYDSFTESDDMEAGFSDVEAEEEAAAKAARLEDAAEARLEFRLKSEKEERRRKADEMEKIIV